MVQMHAFYVFLGVAGLLAAAFLYVALSTRNARDINIHTTYSLRRRLFIAVLAVLVLGMGSIFRCLSFEPGGPTVARLRLRSLSAIADGHTCRFG